MSNLATAARLREAASQLPVSWYCDPDMLAREQALLFARGPGYVGHELMVPEVGDYQALAWRDNAQVLVRNAAGVELLSNICRHRQAIMLDGRGSASNIVCPIHRWTYDLKGQLLGAPHFAQQPCLKLRSAPLQNWRGLLFDGPRDIAADLKDLGVSKAFDFSGYVLDRIETHECNYNWKTFIEVYLEDYHVGPFHPGLGGFVTCEDLAWNFGSRFSLQTVGVNNGLAKPGTKTYARWHKAVLDYYQGDPPRHGAIWATIYPNIMLGEILGLLGQPQHEIRLGHARAALGRSDLLGKVLALLLAANVILGDDRAAVIDLHALGQAIALDLLREDARVDRHTRADRDRRAGVQEAQRQLARADHILLAEVHTMAGVGANARAHAQRCVLAPREIARDLALA